MFDDILGALVVRHSTEIEIPLPQAPSVEVVEEKEEEIETKKAEQEKEEEEKEEQIKAETTSAHTKVRVDDPNTAMTVYQASEHAPTDDDETPVTRRELKALETSLQSKLDWMLALLEQKKD